MDVDPTHFRIGPDGEFYPQEWMQLRRVQYGLVDGQSKVYPVSGGGNKNDLVQSLQVAWTNDTPLGALVYGEVTRGGTKVTLQATSQGGLVYYHGRSTVPGPITLLEASRIGCGLNIGRGGTLGTATAFGITEIRQYGITMPLCPEVTGLVKLAPGETFTGRVDCRFVSTNWEGGDPDGGAAGSESSYNAGELILELFALPDIV